jgi:hypothetical protein
MPSTVGRRRTFVAALAALVALAAPAAAHASYLLARDASDVQLAVDSAGRALVTYEAAGRERATLAWGAVNALTPTSGLPQVRFRLDYAATIHYGRRRLVRAFARGCRRYDGPPLAWLVAACKAPDGSYWALQSWQRLLPHRGYAPWRPGQGAWELRLSHWAGETAALDVWTDWAFGGEAHDLFGRLRYAGEPVYGLRDHDGSPLDGYGRNLYIDTYDSAYGPGWKRETSILFRRPTGSFCYSFWPTRDHTLPGYPNNLRPAGNGERYRITVIGPGVTPDVMWEGTGLHDFRPGNPDDVLYEARMNSLFDEVTAGDRFCPTQH